jgi:oxalate---CoA ligase
MSTASTIGEILSDHATRDPDAAAIVYSRSDVLTFADLDRLITEVRVQFRAAGIGSMSRVGIAMPRGPEAAVLSIAVCSAAILIPLNPHRSTDELQAELKALRLDALIVPRDGTLPGWATAAGEGCGLFTVDNSPLGSVNAALQQVRVVGNSRGASHLSAQSLATIFNTSGTTGTPKRVPVTHGNLLAMADKMERWLALTPADRSACIMPIYYNAGFKATLLVPLLVGCSVALPASTAPRDFEQWVGELRPTWLAAAPPFLQSLVEQLRGRSDGESAPSWASLRFVLSTASYLPTGTAAELEALLGRPVVEFYGLAEAGMMTAPVLPPVRAKPGTVGRIPEGELAIRADNGVFLPAGQTGNVVVRGPSVMPGYILGDIDDAPTGLEDGWLSTTDVGVVDDDGLLTIVGRRTELINRGGEKVSPYQVERALLRHPAVREAAVFSIPHPRLGENVGAAVVLHDSAPATSRELLEFLYDRVAYFEMPRRIHIVESLPVSARGKIVRSELSRMFAKLTRQEEAAVGPLEILIAGMWQRLLQRDDIGMDEDFFDLGGDSLQAVEMMLEVEKATGRKITLSDVRVQLTIRHLAEVLATAAAAEAKREVMTLARSGTGTPVFWWHGDCSGWGLYAVRLATLLEGNSPVYLLHSILDNDGIETIEDMVQHHLPHIEAIAKNGPIRLTGFCNGGLAALETAAQLEKAGHTVKTVTLIDVFSINARPFPRLIASLISLAGRIVPGRAGFRLRRDGMLALWSAIRLLLGDESIIRRVTRKMRWGALQTWHQSSRALYYRAMAQYIPRPIRADVICLLSEDALTRKDYATGPWKRLAASVRHAPIPGEHLTCVSRHGGELAACLNRMMVV